MFFVFIATLTHVPTYGTCMDNCCVPPKDPTISQVIYIKGTGGLELHLDDILGPTIDFDAVFRDNVDPATFRLYVGCGGCMPSDPIVIEPYLFDTYQEVEVEPFTQTAYQSAFPVSQRTFETSRLSNCTQGHFTVRLVDDIERTEPIVWGAVVGLGEEFTPMELLEFPIYVLRNHGDSWNDLWYTYWAWLLLLVLIVLVIHRCNIEFRSAFHDIALVGFLAAALEMLTHLIYVQVGHPIGWGFWVALFLVIGLSNGVPILIVLGMRRLRGARWAPWEILGGLSLLFLFGSGFYVGPIALVLSGFVRLVPSPARDVVVVYGNNNYPHPVARQRGYACEKHRGGSRSTI